jgi:hypothetical protein
MRRPSWAIIGKWSIFECDKDGRWLDYRGFTRTRRRAKAIAYELSRELVDGSYIGVEKRINRKDISSSWTNAPLSGYEMYCNMKYGRKFHGCSPAEFLIWKLSQ